MLLLNLETLLLWLSIILLVCYTVDIYQEYIEFKKRSSNKLHSLEGKVKGLSIKENGIKVDIIGYRARIKEVDGNSVKEIVKEVVNKLIYSPFNYRGLFNSGN